MIDSHNRSKLDEKSIKCIFVGYCAKSKAYRLYVPVGGKVIISRNVVFNEEGRWTWHEDEKGSIQFEAPIEEAPMTGDPQQEDQQQIFPSLPSQASPMSPSSSESSQTSSNSSSPSQSSSDEVPPRGFKSLRKLYETTQALYVSDPTNFKEAMGRRSGVKL